MPALANAELIYLDCYHSLVREDGSLADNKMPSRVVIDLENKIVEEDKKVFEGKLVSISPSQVEIIDHVDEVYGNSVTSISREDLVYRSLFRFNGDVYNYRGQCTKIDPPNRAF